MSPTSMDPRTGDPRVVSTPSRTKPDADHAGLSVPPLVLRTPTSKRLVNFSPSLSNNSFPASHTAMAATVDGNTEPSSTSRSTDKPSSLNTHTPLDTEPPAPASRILPNSVRSLSPDTSPLEETAFPNLRLPLTRTSSPSPSRPTNQSSKCTTAVSSTPPLAEPNSTTPSLPLDTVPRVARTTTSSETPGVLPGETKVTSRSPPSRDQVSAVSRCNPSTQPCEKILQA